MSESSGFLSREGPPEWDVSFKAEVARMLAEGLAWRKRPEAWMGMALNLRYAADILERRVVEAAHERIPYCQPTFDVWQGDCVGAEWSPEHLTEMRSLDREIVLNRPSQLLYQLSYENAFKGLITLQGVEPSNSHDLVALAMQATLKFEELESMYLSWLTIMNQMGRYEVGFEWERDDQGKKVKREKFGTMWVQEYEERRARIDPVFAEGWIQAGGPPWLARLDQAHSH